MARSCDKRIFSFVKEPNCLSGYLYHRGFSGTSKNSVAAQRPSHGVCSAAFGTVMVHCFNQQFPEDTGYQAIFLVLTLSSV